MASEWCNGVGKTNVQQVFAMLEDPLEKKLVKPAATGIIRPAGRASITQSPTFKDSPELSNTLDVVAQSKNSMPPGDFSIPMVIRLSPAAAPIQGDALLYTAMGKQTLTASAKRLFSLDICRPTCSLWIQNDHTVQFMQGCVVENMSFPLERDGLATITLSGRGSRSGVVGNGELAVAPTTTSIKLDPGQAMAFSVGGYITNASLTDGTEFEITAVDTATDTLTLATAPTGWAAGELIAPWLPAATPIGETCDNESIALKIEGVAARIKPSTFTASMPTQFLEEIGDKYPRESADNKRQITMGMNIYFRKENANLFGQTLAGKEVPVEISVSNKNGSFVINMPRVRMGAVSIGEDGAVSTLDSTGTALGVVREDSFTITVNA